MEIKLNTIKPNPKNPRVIKDEKFVKLVKSLTDFPEMMAKRPLVCVTDVDGKMYPLGGNMRLKALQELQYKEIPAAWVTMADEWTEEQRKEFIIKDNVGFGEWDWEDLANNWDQEQLTDWGLDIPGFDVAPEAVEDDFDGVAPKDPITVLGDLYELNEHRLHCADSCDSDAVAKLMNGSKSDIMFTSPPYNAGKTPTEVKMGKNSKYTDDNDNKTESEYLDLLKGFTVNALLYSIYSFVNVQSIAGNKTALIEYLYNFKETYADTLIWQKQTAQPAMAKNVLNSQFEYIHCFSEKANRAIGVKPFRGTLSNVIQISKQTNNEVKSHNATFPFAFAAYFIENFSIQSVLDLFLGSGTTLIASDQLNRICYGQELDPKYCDVIVSRYIKHRQSTGSSLVIKRNGQQLSEDEINKYIENTHAESK